MRVRMRVGERKGSGVERLCQQQVQSGAGVEADVPSWKGRRGRFAAAKEWRITTVEAISVGERGGFGLVVVVVAER